MLETCEFSSATEFPGDNCAVAHGSRHDASGIDRVHGAVSSTATARVLNPLPFHVAYVSARDQRHRRHFKGLQFFRVWNGFADRQSG
jgi:hypothetical protein